MIAKRAPFFGAHEDSKYRRKNLYQKTLIPCFCWQIACQEATSASAHEVTKEALQELHQLVAKQDAAKRVAGEEGTILQVRHNCS